jgi:hypothetical protein
MDKRTNRGIMDGDAPTSGTDTHTSPEKQSHHDPIEDEELTTARIRDGDDPTSSADTHWSQKVQRHYDPTEDEELTTALVFAIAAAKGVSPTKVKSPPLYESVDVPAIENAFFGPDVAGDSRQGVGTVEFQYTDYLVKIRSDRWIQVYELTEPDLS